MVAIASAVGAFVLFAGGDDHEGAEPAATIAATVVTLLPPGTGVAPPPGEPVDFVGGNTVLDAFAASCFAGDMQACDDLYTQAPAGSLYQLYGDTCARRQPAGTNRYCTVTFGAATTTTTG